jgi:hypothetical protein
MNNKQSSKNEFNFIYPEFETMINLIQSLNQTKLNIDKMENRIKEYPDTEFEMEQNIEFGKSGYNKTKLRLINLLSQNC